MKKSIIFLFLLILFALVVNKTHDIRKNKEKKDSLYNSLQEEKLRKQDSIETALYCKKIKDDSIKKVREDSLYESQYGSTFEEKIINHFKEDKEIRNSFTPQQKAALEKQAEISRKKLEAKYSNMERIFHGLPPDEGMDAWIDALSK